uniref:Uncharacterized protein n=1 Tax=Arundo donax TaxID=35708 RepID=A0A0A9CY14_ARUDO
MHNCDAWLKTLLLVAYKGILQTAAIHEGILQTAAIKITMALQKEYFKQQQYMNHEETINSNNITAKVCGNNHRSYILLQSQMFDVVDFL